MHGFLPFLSLSFLSLLVPALASPILEARQGVSILSPAEVADYRPYTHYAFTASCSPAKTLTWSCGGNCDANPQFLPIASGGDGAIVQRWYVGYDPALDSIIVGYQGTDTSKLFPLLTDANILLTPLNPFLFPGVPLTALTHDGFNNAHALSANAVLSAVRTGLAQHNTTNVAVVGHSLGGALAVISTLHLSIHLPAGTAFRTVTYGMPRVGNAIFADLVNSVSVMNRINNKYDIIPVLPPRVTGLGYVHTEGEIHIVNSGDWVSCPGEDNTNSQCSIGYVPIPLLGDVNDHSGPFDGVQGAC
ncbi:lipase [Coprinopsis cinerea okayama7|uniref:Lipase n=1 Tax=Coprinopsis cinerea (strain Okayama-7 / 130 / ATCC MYA-4618 / FGSC 9003) TaxID=240176 RepID=A8N8K9_COPC7|nr:lipase [Coprinopsis cinerea okayama7\|eukprot:XP_001831165.1 lipase [Coprinopsis cinerea okayama7\